MIILAWRFMHASNSDNYMLYMILCLPFSKVHHWIDFISVVSRLGRFHSCNEDIAH